MRKKIGWQVSGLQLLMMSVGSFLLALTYYHINFQNGLTEGGFVGLALAGKYLFNWPPALSMLALDIPVFIAAFIFRGHRFILNTIYASIIFTLSYELCEQISPFIVDLSSNMLLAAIVSGIMSGLGAGLVLRAGGATGGDDILALMLNQWSGLKIGTVFILMDVLVLMISLIYLPFAATMYTVLSVFIAGKVITWTVHTGTKQKQVPAKVRIPLAVKDKTAQA